MWVGGGGGLIYILLSVFLFASHHIKSLNYLNTLLFVVNASKLKLHVYIVYIFDVSILYFALLKEPGT